jgi:hypothetical protein
VKAFHPVQLSTDLANLALPNLMTWIGNTWFPKTTLSFGEILGQTHAYLGIPLLVIVALVAPRAIRSAGVRVLTAVFLIAVALSFGPTLKIANVRHAGPLPWRLVMHVPILKKALPERLILYALLAAAVAVAVFAAARRWRILRYAVIGTAVAFTLPNVFLHLWHINTDHPTFFSTDAYQRSLKRGEVVAVVSLNKGDQMLWQAQTDMYFRLAGGYLGLAPPHYADVEFFRRLQFGDVKPTLEGLGKFQQFAAEHDVRTLIGFRLSKEKRRTFAYLTGSPPRHVQGVLLYRVRPLRYPAPRPAASPRSRPRPGATASCRPRATSRPRPGSRRSCA